MDFTGFEPEDFAVFTIPEFEGRMEAIRSRVRPKLAALAEILAPRLSEASGASFYPHVAAHARRRVNPPEETWMALSRSPRGYKRYAHFEVGMGATDVFARLVVKPEADDKPAAALALRERGPGLSAELPGSYLWAVHRDGAPDTPWPNADGEGLVQLGVALGKKTAGLAVGRRVGREDPAVAAREPFLRLVEAVFRDLFPLYAAIVRPAAPAGAGGE